MKSKGLLVKWIGGIIFPVASLALLLTLGFSVTDVRQAWDALLNVRRGFLYAVVGCWCGYVGFRAAALTLYCRYQGCRLGFLSALRVTFIGFFYSGITPAATGGQPMQIFELSKSGVPVSVGTSAIAVETAGFQFLLVILTAGMWLAFRQTVMLTMSVTRWMLVIGLLVNVVWTLFLVVVLVKGAWVAKPVEVLLKLLGRWRMLRNPDKSVEGLRAYVEDYEMIAEQLFKRPALMIASSLLSGLQVLCYMSMVYFLYRGFGWSSTSYGVIVTIQMLMYLCASLLPTPGATGAQEGAFYLFMGNIFPESSVFPAMLVWRFFTYYLMLITGGVTLLVGMFRTRRMGLKGSGGARDAVSAAVSASPEGAEEAADPPP